MLRPRLIGYGLITVLAAVAVGMGFMHKTQLLTDVQRSRNALFTELPDGRFCNDFQIKLESFNPGINRVDIQVVSKKHLYDLEGNPPGYPQLHAVAAFRMPPTGQQEFIFHYGRNPAQTFSGRNGGRAAGATCHSDKAGGSLCRYEVVVRATISRCGVLVATATRLTISAVIQRHSVRALCLFLAVNPRKT